MACEGAQLGCWEGSHLREAHYVCRFVWLSHFGVVVEKFKVVRGYCSGGVRSRTSLMDIRRHSFSHLGGLMDGGRESHRHR